MSEESKSFHGILKTGSRGVPVETVITWDEEIIAEHDKDRGTRMKIDEPNTPYYMCSESIDEHDLESYELDGRELDEFAHRGPVSADELRQRLEMIHSRQEQGLDSEESCTENEEERKKKKDFEAKRRAHYNEFLVMKQLRSSGSLDESDESDASLRKQKQENKD